MRYRDLSDTIYTENAATVTPIHPSAMKYSGRRFRYPFLAGPQIAFFR